MTLIKKHKSILLLLLLAFCARLFVSPFMTLTLDQNTFIAWSKSLASLGPKTFYNSWSDYLPGYLYILWILGEIKTNILPLTILYKLPAILFDLATGTLIYLILQKRKKALALLGAGIYLFNPAVIANSSLWGQIDGITSFFALLSVHLAKTNIYFSLVALALGTLVKPQALVALPAIVYVLLLQTKLNYTKFFQSIILSVTVFVIAFIPFWSEGNLYQFIYTRFTAPLTQYPYTSINAFNFWAFHGFWKPDGQGLFSLNSLGTAIALAISLFAFLVGLRKKTSVYKILTIFFLANFLFFTRIHERHLLPAIAPLTIASTTNSLSLLALLIISITYVANLAYSYIWVTNNFKEIFTPETIYVFSILNLFALALVFKSTKSNKQSNPIPNLLKKISTSKREKFKDNISKNLSKKILFIILLFSLITRLAFLNYPNKEYFDEVYHAFTAKVMLEKDPKGWEWWNKNPEGYAYEWTHPPLAKIFMVAGMQVFGENAFGWRVPAALLGTGIIFLVYKIALTLFKSRDIALLASAILSLDGLVLTMSRIGMNDIYLLFFILLSFYFTLKNQHVKSSIALGLALSSKWSALWAIPLLAVAFISQNNLIQKFQFKKIPPTLLSYILIPPIVYLLTYAGLFLSGHDFSIFWGVQKQMWWYHTRLDATHAYTSKWWTWPLLIKPIWLFVENQGEIVKKIYAMGNPAVFWFGGLSVLASAYYSFKNHNKNLGLVILGYVIFFVPWALSPRIMFLYHYLPSLPFLAICSGYVLKKHAFLVLPFFTVALVMFLYFYPHWTGIGTTQAIDNSYYWLKSWR